MVGACPGDRLRDLDVLRGLAAMLVLLFHFTTRYSQLYGHVSAPALTVPWGHVGVSFFFGISGFVISMTLERTRSAADFLVSRFSRLFPAYWAALALTLAAVASYPIAKLGVTPAAAAINLSMLEGFLNVPYVDGVCWTLTVELAFYLCMLLLFLTGMLRRLNYVLIPWLCLKWIWWLLPGASWLLGTLLIQRYIPFFAIGIAAYRLYSRQGNPAVAGAVMLFALLTVLVIDGPAQATVALLLGSVMIAVALRKLAWLEHAPLLWLGSISYTLYLLHQHIGFILLNGFERMGLGANMAIAAALLLCLALADVVSRWVERPALAIIRQRWRMRAAGAAAVAVVHPT
jgi:peptidoglycan/LPS O-acetylase OafA/YrhL